MSIKRAAAIVGVADLELEKGRFIGDKTVLQIQAEVAKKALEDAGLTKDDVDGILVAGSWGGGGFASVMMAEYLGIRPKFTDSTNIGGSSFEAHVGHAAAAIQAGLCEVCIILYGSDQKTARSRNMARRRPAELTAQYEAPFGMPAPIGAYAMAAHRHMHQYGTTSEQLAEIAVSTRKWAELNPRATMRDPITVEDVINSPMICDPLHLLDCCLVTDGAGAVVVAAPHRVKDCRKKPVWILGHGESHTHAGISNMPDLTVTTAKQSGEMAMAMAGVRPEEFDLIQIYDSFTITVLITLESLGFCKPGEGADFVANGRTAPGGALPMNTNGGGLSCQHPGMYGIFLLIEAVQQLRGECGPRQVPDAKLCLVNGTGGVLSSTATCVLARD